MCYDIPCKVTDRASVYCDSRCRGPDREAVCCDKWCTRTDRVKVFFDGPCTRTVIENCAVTACVKDLINWQCTLAVGLEEQIN